MALKKVLCLTGLCALSTLSSGCGVLVDITRRVVVDQVHYNETVDELKICARNRLVAESAWRQYERENSECDLSHHFAQGFKQGFVEYVNVGATEPPVLPPRRYWKVHYQTLEGQRAINEWFTGFRFGVIAAEQSGYRDLMVIPVSIPSLHPGDQCADAGEPAGQHSRYQAATRPAVQAADGREQEEAEESGDPAEWNDVLVLRIDSP